VPVALAALLAGAAPDPVADAVAAVEAAVRDYQESLGRLLEIQQRERERAEGEARRFEQLYRDGLVSRLDAERRAEAARAARAEVEATRARMGGGEQLVAEARALLRLAALPPPQPGAERSTPWAVEYRGVTPWSVARVQEVDRYFAERFGRPLPVSALGQTALHDRLGFDHRHAVDVAVHPESAEGRALLDWLRARGVPYLAFRDARPGVSTGAHVHIGAPSPRL
jgi:hypothetical protein